MSDIKQNEITIMDGGGMLNGSDGKPSIRRWGALVSFFTSVGFMAWSMVKIAEVNALALVHLIYFAPGVAFLVVCLILIGFVNKQNIALIKSLISKEKS